MRHDAPSASILSRRPWLLDASTWTVESGPGDPATPADAGAWPIGNGWVFAHAGLRRPYNRLCGLTGPTYQAADKSRAGFGDCWLALRTERGPFSAKTGIIGRPRDSGVLVTAEGGRGGGAAVVTVDFAPPDDPVLVRIVEVWGGARLGSDAVLEVHLPGGAPHDERRRSLRKVADDRRTLILAALAPGRWAEPGRLEIRLEHVGSEGGVWQLPLVLAFGPDTDDAVAWLRQPFDVHDLLDQTRAYYRLWLTHTRTPDLWPQNLAGPTATTRSIADLIEETKLNLKMHQARPGGVACPMVYPDAARARDATGPVRAFLAMGARDDALDVLEYYYRAAIVLGRIPNAVPVDLDVTGIGEAADWNAVQPADGTGPPHIVLQHRWWLEAGGDPDVIRRHWPYLVRCLARRPATPDALLPFDGDEPYLHGALYTTYPERCGWPNDFIADWGTEGYAVWSLEAMALRARAHEALGWMAQQIGRAEEAHQYLAEAERVRRLIESRFWLRERGHYAPAIYPLSGAPHDVPFAAVNLAPLWLGFHGPEDAHARQNLEAVVDLVGFTGITPNCEYTVGVVPGYLLWGLVAVASDLAPLALANLVAMASPAGEWAELYAPGGVPHPGADAEHPSRARPNESGVNLVALYRYFAERRPSREPASEFRGLARRGRTFGPGPSRAVAPATTPDDPRGVIVVTADAADVTAAAATLEARGGTAVTVVEPGRPFGPDYLGRLLFDRSGRRTVDVLILGASALAGDRRSMKPARFWQCAEAASALDRFVAAGGRVVRPPAQ